MKSLHPLWRSRDDTPEASEPDAEPERYLQIDFEGLQAVNPDVIAWIDIPGLSISYPVVQGTDNAYYLHHLFTGEYNSSGSISQTAITGRILRIRTRSSTATI